jgi:hypothetical protein
VGAARGSMCTGGGITRVGWRSVKEAARTETSTVTNVSLEQTVEDSRGGQNQGGGHALVVMV